ncbi:MAG TPA: ABC transporter permease, partial [Rhizomicrobium sp.]|nr:ABC transporter permease [Rhizomicrobium sp.]
MNRVALLRIAYPLLGLLILLAVWHFYIILFHVPEVVMPTPLQVADALMQNWQALVSESGATLLECLYGFALAVAAGILIAVLISTFDVLNQIFYPILIATQSVPKVAIAPVILIWFGVGMESKVAIAFVVAFFPMVIDTATGLRSTSREMLDLARVLNCSPLQTFWKIQLPSALPFIFSGAKVAVTLAVVGAVIGEFVGSSSGLGNLLLAASAQVEVPLVWASLVFLSAIGMLLFAGVALAERLLMPWAPG